MNFGHTFANAIENLSQHQVSHGEAVAIGMVIAAELSAALGYCSPKIKERIEKVLDSAQLPTKIPRQLAPEQILLAMRSDKKKKAGKLRYILIKDIGDLFRTEQVKDAEVIAAMKKATV